MKSKILNLSLFILIISCAKPTNSDEFIENVTGRYLYTSDQVIEVYFKDKVLLMNWKGIKDIEPMKLGDDVFFVKEMNEKVMFKTNPKNQQKYLVLVPKEDGAKIEYNFKKLKEGELIPSEYLANNEYEKALKGYLAIKEKDSLDVAINEREMNSLGYYHLRSDNFEQALNIFKINAALHPYSYNVYDSLAEAYLKSGDTLQAIVNYKKALVYDSGNERIKRTINELEVK
ncbi:tetratricopeptide repeat protein [Aureibaculum sp. 2210JD6-5]|uniref:tetratricopeptide repeat protein n=1 Tax=Aureibaculum sp. 2210JD6-5 TaxID=3103957 RepID=UPI002AAD843C|nr:tetratricopeptide repeat protein [Aureibaculum sp. 2210JD6-5]MDY7395625.1 tetratricopeptide repeat protein [Aureibaculum sp. 2210JD6-5]